MIILFPAIVIVIFFFYSGRSKKDNGIKWSIVGLIGYVLGFSIGMVTIGETFISVIIACVVVFLSHVQLSRAAIKQSN